MYSGMLYYKIVEYEWVGENGEFDHSCVFETNKFEVLDVGAWEDVWGDARGWGGARDTDMS